MIYKYINNYTDKSGELVTSKPPTTLAWEKEIENTNVTRGNVDTIHTNKYIEHPPNKPTIASVRDRQVWESTYTNSHNRKRVCQPTTLSAFVWLNLLRYIKPKQDRQQSVRIQPALCEVACEQNSYGCKQQSE